MTLPIPAAALQNHIAILGKTGSGKTVAAKNIVEHVLDAGGRCCAIDPTGVWHGLRSNSSGKGPGYPVVIFGGPHGDVPLAEGHGDAVAEIVGTSSTSAIMDTSLMRVGERTRFFSDFAETLIRKNKGPLHLMVDEAHLFMPQGRVADPASGKMLHAANNLVSLGRSRGLRITIISQRPAKVHKDSLTQIESLIAMRLIAPQDRRAVEDWIADNADPAKGREIITSLATLKTGEAWIWAPEIGTLDRIRFPKNRTFDSSRAPDGDRHGPVLAPIDLKAVHEKLGAIEEEIRANDPRLLKAEVAKLRAQIAQMPAETCIDAQAIDNAHAEGFESGRKGIVDMARPRLVEIRDAIGKLHQITEGVNGKISDLQVDLSDLTIPSVRSSVGEQRLSKPRVAGSSPAGRSNSPAVHNITYGLSNPQQRILDALAWLASIGITSADRPRAAFLADQSHRSSGFEKNVSTIKTRGLIIYPTAGAIALTDEGRRAANKPAAALNNEALWAAIRSHVSAPQWAILSTLIDAYPAALARDELASGANASPSSSGFEKNVSTMRSLGFIDYPEAGMVVATDFLFVGH